MQNTTTVLVIILAVVLVLFLFGGVGMMGFGMLGPGMMRGGMMGSYGWGFSPFGAILSLASWGLLIGGGVLLAVWLVRNSGRSSSQSTLDILKARYAKGEITKEQYEQMKRDLGV